MEDCAGRELVELVLAEFRANRQLIHSQFQVAQRQLAEQFQATKQSLASSQEQALEVIATRLNTELPQVSCRDELTSCEVFDGSGESKVYSAVCPTPVPLDIQKYMPLIQKEVNAELRRRLSEVGQSADRFAILVQELDVLEETTFRTEERVEALHAQGSQRRVSAGTDTDDLQLEEERSCGVCAGTDTDDLKREEELPEADRPQVIARQFITVSEQLSCKQPRGGQELLTVSEQLSARQPRGSQGTKVQATQAHLQRLADLHANSDMDDLRLRNRDLLSTVEQFTQDCELLEVENRRLRESATNFESEKERADGERAKLMGHSNPKQKIKYTVKLHEENNRLREDYQKLRKQCSRLEASKRGNLCEDLPSLFALSLAGSSQHRSSTTSSVAAGKAWGLSTTQETVLEGVVQDCLHLRALVERAVSDAESDDAGSKGDISTLLERLRHIVADGPRNRQGLLNANASDEASTRAPSGDERIY